MWPEPPRLEVLERLASELGDASTAADARALKEKAEEGRFYVACIGQFKRGKSTLLNALVGRPLLPMGVVPLTSVPTVLRAGAPKARAQFADGAWRDIEATSIEDFVSERGNPSNEKGVRLVEVFSESPLLGAGTCLVDTPGIGSIIEANGQATRGFVPHIDAALVVLGVDPPLSGEELALVEEVAGQVEHLLVVLNKVDRFPPDERQEARAFTARAVERRLGRRPAVLEVSALERLQGGAGGPDFDGLVSALTRLSLEAGAQLSHAAEVRGRARLSGRLRAELEGRKLALLRPLAESERRLEALRRATAEGERALGDLSALLRGEEQRLRGALEGHRGRFLAHAGAIAESLKRRAEGLSPLPRRQLRARLNDVAQELARAHVTAWREEEQPEVERLYQDAMSRFVALGNRFLEQLSGPAEQAAAAFAPLDEAAALGARSRLCFTDLMRLTAPPLFRRLAVALSPSRVARRLLVQDAQRYLWRLLEANSSRLQFDLDERIQESRGQLERGLRARLREAVAAGERALAAARETLLKGREAVAAERSRLEQLERPLFAGAIRGG